MSDQLSSSAITELAQAIKAAVEETAPIKQVHISQHKAPTAFNPKGTPEHLRPQINGTFLQNGTRPALWMLSDDEINLINKLKAGRYLDRKVEVGERTENGERTIEIRYSNASVEQRMEMKNEARNLKELLEKIIAEQKPDKQAKSA